MPLGTDDRKLNNLFLDNTKKRTEKFTILKDLLEKGADPFAIHTSSTGIKSTPFTTALINDYPEFVKEMLLHSAKYGHPINLSDASPLESIDNPKRMNWIHFAILNSTSDCLEEIRNHQNEYFKTKSSFKKAVNDQFYYNFPVHGLKLSNIGSVALWTISLNNLRVNGAALGDDNSKFEKFVSKWMFLSATGTPPYLDPNTVVQVMGPESTFEFLLRNGLNKYATDHNGRTLTELITYLQAASQDPAKWNSIRKFFIWDGIEQTSAAEKAEYGSIMKIILQNFYFKHATNCHGTPQFEELQRIILTTKPEAFDELAAVVDTHTDQINGLNQRVTTLEFNVDALSHEIAQVAKIQRGRIRNSLSKDEVYLNMFNKFYASIEPIIRQTRDKKFGIFQANPSSKDKFAHNLLSVFSFALQSCPVTPFASVIPALGQVLLNCRTEWNNAKQSNAVLKGTLSVEPEDLATYLAAFLTAEVMHLHGKRVDGNYRTPTNPQVLTQTLIAKVKTQVERMSELTGQRDPNDVLCFLATPAMSVIKALRVPSDSPPQLVFSNPNKPSNGSGSNGSQSTPRTVNDEVPLPRLTYSSSNSEGKKTPPNAPQLPAQRLAAIAATRQQQAAPATRQQQAAPTPPQSAKPVAATLPKAKRSGSKCVVM